MSCMLGEQKPTISTASNNNNNTKLGASCNISISNSISTNTNTNTTTTNTINTATISTQETCLICGDIASGKHYGLRSCEACKAFFKRTVQGKIEYSCPATKECEINKRRRKACQACRFQKCLNMGMLKEGVRLDRVRGGRQKYRRGLSPSTTTTNQQQQHQHQQHQAGTNALMSSTLVGANSSANAASSSLMASSGSANMSSSNQQISIHHTNSEINKIMTALINSEPDLLTASTPDCLSNLPASLSGQMKTLYILSYLFDKELVCLISWAKQIPGFSETIKLIDQMRLLQSTWAEVIALSICYRSHMRRIEYQNRHNQHNSTVTSSPTSSSSPASTISSYNSGGNTKGNIHAGAGIGGGGSNSINSAAHDNAMYLEVGLVFAKDLTIDFNLAIACGADEIFYSCIQLIRRFESLKITQKEYMILKALCLANADVPLENPRTTHHLRDLIMETLNVVTLGDNVESLLRGNGCSSFSVSPGSINDSANMLGLNSSSNNANNFSNNLSNVNSNQDRSSSSMASITSANNSPPRPSSSVPSSSSMLSISASSNCAATLASPILGPNKKPKVNNRLNQILLCLPAIRQIDLSIRKFWNEVRRGPSHVPMKSLFEEMLEPYQKL